MLHQRQIYDLRQDVHEGLARNDAAFVLSLIKDRSKFHPIQALETSAKELPQS